MIWPQIFGLQNEVLEVGHLADNVELQTSLSAHVETLQLRRKEFNLCKTFCLNKFEI
jgi:hypothetical protein